jgi:hypothetical protein
VIRLTNLEEPLLRSSTVETDTKMCTHSPRCPEATDPRCCSAHVEADHSEQGWCRLCNGVILFDDGLYMAPDGHVEQVPQLTA